MKDIYIVETPLQLICAYEIINKSKKEYILLLRCSGVGRNDAQMEFGAKLLRLKYRKIFIRPNSVYIDTIKELINFSDIIFSRFDRIYIGSYFSRFIMSIAKVIRSNKRFLLDDGVATLLAQKKMAEKGVVYDLATFFNIKLLPGQNKITHSFEKIRDNFNLDHTAKSIFIGQILVERNFLTLDEYVALVENAKSRVSGDFIYIPHRAESKKTTAEISKIKGINVEYSETCIELHLLTKGIYPENIFSSVSSAIFSLSAIFPNSKIHSLIHENINASNSPHFQDILDALSDKKNVSIEWLKFDT